MPSPPETVDFAHALVIEDDPVTGEFLAEALRRAGWDVALAAGVATGLHMARQRPPDLLLCDHGLPDGDAFDVAIALWPDSGGAATAPRPAAIALSAELPDDLRARLHAAGYPVVLSKPIPLADLLAALPSRGLSSPSQPPAGPVETSPEHGGDEPAVLDDDAALAVCGGMETVQALRDLLAGELRATLDAIQSSRASGETRAVRDHLHRLRASCGFCGAVDMEVAIARVRFDSDTPEAVDATIAAVLAAGEALSLALERSCGLDDGRSTQQ